MKPTILIFLKAPVAGQAKTRLAAGMGDMAALEIYQQLVHRQMAVLPDDWSVEIHFSPPREERMMRAWLGEQDNWSFHPQIDEELGDRLAHAVTEAFKRGARATLLLGGDCPELDEEALRQAAQAMDSHDVVMGPTFDGGYYLLGIKRPLLGLFGHSEWGTDRVADRTRAILRENRWSCTELPRLRDVDTVEDWRASQKGE